MKRTKKAVPYYRVSTGKQGDSGLGLEAQKEAIQRYAEANEIMLCEGFSEVESGRKSSRPQLTKALEACREQGAQLITAKLDRLARDVTFIDNLMDSDIKFTAVDNPDANRLVLHILAAIAEDESERASIRTKEALAAAKRRGISLGVFCRDVLSKRNCRRADSFARKMKSIIGKLQKQGHQTVRSLTDALNRDGVSTYFGGNARWHPHSVHQLLKRIEHLSLKKI